MNSRYFFVGVGKDIYLLHKKFPKILYPTWTDGEFSEYRLTKWKNVSTAFGLIKGATFLTTALVAVLISGQDSSTLVNHHIINARPPPSAALV